jgi:hypothetical protein
VSAAAKSARAIVGWVNFSAIIALMAVLRRCSNM